MINLVDCTLRDGANVVGNGFSGPLTISMTQALLDCGIQDIELGHAKGLGAAEKLGAPAPLSDLEYMELVAPYLDKGRIGMFMLAKCADSRSVQTAAEHGLHFLRVGMDAGDGIHAVKAVELVKKFGLVCRYSLMKAYICTPSALASEAAMLEQAGVDRITIMDSAGTMFPDQVREYVQVMKQTVSIPVGFHGHSNLGLSQANALAAFEAGADEIDCGLLGMARSAGNCSTEVAAACFRRIGLLQDVDLDKLLHYLDTELIPAMTAYGYRPAVHPEDLVLGMAGCHSSFLGRFRKIAEEENVPLYRLIADVSLQDRKAPSEDLIRSCAARKK